MISYKCVGNNTAENLNEISVRDPFPRKPKNIDPMLLIVVLLAVLTATKMMIFGMHIMASPLH